MNAKYTHSNVQAWLSRRVCYLGIELQVEPALTTDGGIRLLDDVGDGFTFSLEQFFEAVNKGLLSLSAASRF